jgi:hypothetical protein
MVVCVHDVCPQFEEESTEIVAALQGLLGSRFSMCVIPQYEGKKWPTTCLELLELVRNAADEVLLHGLSHRRRRNWSPLSWAVRGCDELASLRPEECRAVIKAGAEQLRQLGLPPAGFVPPAWRVGSVDISDVSNCGMSFIAGLRRVDFTNGYRQPLATWSWDCGRLSAGGMLASAIGATLALSEGAIPCVVLHPEDIVHGLMHCPLRHIERLLERGYNPVTFSDLSQTMCPS